MSARGLARLAVIAMLLGGGVMHAAHADLVSDSVKELSRRNTDYKVRLSAALALAKSKDPRAIIALADALERDEDPTIRRVAALALEKMIDSSTPADANALAFQALDRAAQRDDDAKVRDTAAKTAKILNGFRKRGGAQPPVAPAAPPAGGARGPEVFVQIDALTDQSKKLTGDTGDRVVRIVRRGVEHTGYATQWPSGGTPSGADLQRARSRAFIVATSVKKVELQRTGGQTQVACTVAMRISPWGGKDGGERWEASKAANATGSAKATTGSGARDVTNGIRDCLETITEDITARQVVPFLRRLATAGS